MSHLRRQEGLEGEKGALTREGHSWLNAERTAQKIRTVLYRRAKLWRLSQ